MLLSAAWLLLQVGAATPPADSVDALLERARDARARYERVARTRAPTILGSGSSRPCDERVGRFCLHHDPDGARPRQAEPPVIARARAELIETLRGIFARLPAEPSVAGPLIQYLVLDERAGEAVAAARTYVAFADDAVHAGLLHGFALHAAGRDSLAENAFAAALDRMPSDERRAFEDVRALLAGDELSLYERLDGAERRAYERDLWTMADPLYLTPGNERRMAHLARRVWVRLLAATPITIGMHRWGGDLEELTLRYGVPTSRAQVREIGLERHMVEWYDSTQLAFVPEALRTRGLPDTPGPDDDWWVDDPRARSQFAPVTVRRLVAIEHRAGRFPADGDSVRFRIDGRLPLDSAAREADALDAGLFVLDADHRRIRDIRTRAPVRDDTAEIAVEVALPPGRYSYSLELLDPASRFAGRARYAVDLPSYATTTLALSDVLGLAPFRDAPVPQRHRGPGGLPALAWDMLPHDTLGIYAEAHHLTPSPGGRTRYGVRVVLRRVDESPGVVRAVRWLGRQLGLGADPERARVAWSGTGEAARPVFLAVDFALEGLDSGLYTLELVVTDRVSGVERRSERFVRVREEDDDG